MKAEIMNESPVFELMKQGDAISFFHLQFPQWLLYDTKYSELSLEAKCVYMLLFNRCQLSKRNGWTNDDKEVFIVYTRQELARILRIGEKRVTSAMTELKEMNLIWERRCGRGFANQIYLSKATLSEGDPVKAKGGPLDKPAPEPKRLEPESKPETVKTPVTAYARPAKTTGLNLCPAEPLSAGIVDNLPPKPISASMSIQDPPETSFKTRQNGGLRTGETALQDPPDQPLSNNDFKKDFKDSRESSQSKSARTYARDRTDADGLADKRMLERIISQTDLEYFEDSKAAVIRDAIERLFYSETLRVQDAVYPKSSIRSNLMRLDYFTVDHALQKMRVFIEI